MHTNVMLWMGNSNVDMQLCTQDTLYYLIQWLSSWPNVQWLSGPMFNGVQQCESVAQAIGATELYTTGRA